MWQIRVVISSFQMEDYRVCSYYQEITLLSLLRTVYSRVMEGILSD